MQELFIKEIKSKKDLDDFDYIPAIHHFSSIKITSPITFFCWRKRNWKINIIRSNRY
ncbi:MAG: hypothetical protein ACK5LC_04940 [Coprobacillaceae bacterium]